MALVATGEHAVDAVQRHRLADLGGGGLRRVWHHDAFGGTLVVGEPVALHGVYGVLARGDERHSVAFA